MNAWQAAEVALVLVGAAVMGGALAKSRAIAATIHNPALQRAWRALTALAAFFVLGYLVYAGVAIVAPDLLPRMSRTLVPAVFCLGGVFVGLTFRLAERTVADLGRVALLERDSVTDALTGLYNRRHFERRLAEEFSRARRQGSELALLLLDVDHFKRINDTHGHPAGDAVLRDLAERCLACVRAHDTVVRYGGEEIAVIAPGAPAHAAQRLAARLRERAASAPLELRGASYPQGLAIAYTVSIGVAALDASMADEAALIGAADAALYRAKREGRNRVSLHAAAAAPSSGAVNA
ncbi:MAG: hypothetical protein OHK0044_33330 [Burkholderiaceae bacterium]